MRSLRSAARKVAVFQRPCGTLSTRRSPRGAQPWRRVMLVLVQILGPGLVDEDETRRIDALLMSPPAPAVALDVRAILLARDQRLFLSVTPMRRKNRLIIDVSAFTPGSASSRSQSACRVMSDFSALSASRNCRCGSSFGRR